MENVEDAKRDLLEFKQYIGDGVYAAYDGYQIILTTGHHDAAKADNIIALEPCVFSSLVHYRDELLKRETRYRELVSLCPPKK